jgi:hypothetical protein
MAFGSKGRYYPLGPHSRDLQRGAIGTLIDGRSPEGRFLRQIEHQLTEHCGGNPTATQRMLIARAARLALMIELQDKKTFAEGGISERSERSYLVWVNAHRRLLAQLGLEAPADKPASEASAILNAARSGP